MNTSPIIIIGAGASGLIAARELSAIGFPVTVVEARERTGGRIHTVRPEGFTNSIEGGPEFIHGNLPITLGLLQKYQIDHSLIEGNIYVWNKGEPHEQDDFIANHQLLEKHLQELTTDISLNDFLQAHFPDEDDEDFKESIRRFVEGYDAADAARASTLYFREEWMQMDDAQWRIPGGYSSLTDALTDECKRNGVVFHLHTEVKKIRWNKNDVEVFCSNDRTLVGTKVIVTVPAGVLVRHGRGSIAFEPPLQEHMNAYSGIGYGLVIKTVLEFDVRMLRDDCMDHRAANIFSQAGWIITDEKIPTWWPQMSEMKLLLTGWIAGPDAAAIADKDDEEIFDMAIKSLNSIFNCKEEALKKYLVARQIFNWSKDDFTRGAYSYGAIGDYKSIELLTQPVDQTIYFAGEALQGKNKGTVEAALVSGLETVARIRAEIKE